jgi:hypothetical protein
VNVPLLKQGGPGAPWGNTNYDHLPPVDANGKPNRISRYGCYLTCCAMLINYHASAQGIGFSTMPDVLNTWLNGQANGYSGAGVNPHAVARYAQQNGVALYYQGPLYRKQDSVVNNYLCTGNPVLLKVPHGNGHWVLATGQTAVNGTDTFLINDPGFQNSTLAGYGFTYTGIRKFSSTRTPPHALLITGHSPIELLITDSFGNQTGFDPITGQIFDQIPNSGYGLEAIADDDDITSDGTTPGTRELDVLMASDGTFTLQVFGTGTGPFTINFTSYDSDGNPTFASVSGDASPGSSVSYRVNYSAAPGSQVTVIPVDVSLPVITGCPANINIGNDPGVCGVKVTWTVPAATDNVGVTSFTSNHNPGEQFPVGITTVTYTATDAAGNQSICSFTVSVQDREPPKISTPTAIPSILWPLNHKMVDVTIDYNVTDSCASASDITCVLSVTSNESVRGCRRERGEGKERERREKDDDDKAFDWVVLDSHHVRLRAEKSEHGDSRIYWIKVTCTDSSGNSSAKTVAVTVSKSRGRDH